MSTCIVHTYDIHFVQLVSLQMLLPQLLNMPEAQEFAGIGPNWFAMREGNVSVMNTIFSLVK